MNVVEIDAASNNGVENIRDIREQVQYPPTEGKYRVYIIDEVHMLSIGAFNALLKTLEEPPAYVILFWRLQRFIRFLLRFYPDARDMILSAFLWKPLQTG